MNEIVRTQGIHKVYGDGVSTHVLKGIDLSVQRGELVAIMGESGSGKSTLLNILGCLDKPSQGKVFIDGVDTSGLDDMALAALRASKVGFVFQHHNLLFEFSALENVSIPMLLTGERKDRAEKRAKELLAMVGLSHRLEHKPPELSGGESQRVAIARALMNSPDIVLADEPTGNLDSASSRKVYELIHGLNEVGYTFLIVTHSEELARGCSRVVRLVDGKVVG
ncbi:MAG: ABC transporter ATP-binding protein [Methermicoccaceae archaeon]